MREPRGMQSEPDVDEILPGLGEITRVVRIVAWLVLLVVLIGSTAALQCAMTADAELTAEREVQAQRTDEHWRHVRAARGRGDEARAALRDSVRALDRSAGILSTMLVRATGARGAIAIGRDTALAGDTTAYVHVGRARDPRKYLAPAFLVASYQLQTVALDSAVHQLGRTQAALAQAQHTITLDSLTFVAYDSTVASLRRERALADRAVKTAARAGRARGFREGVLVTVTLTLLGVVVW